jgi:hypothetical protein
VGMPNSAAARMIRMAISPRFDTSSFIFLSLCLFLVFVSPSIWKHCYLE